MLIQLVVLFEIVMIIICILAFFTKQELLWAVAVLLSGVLMVISFNVEYVTYQYNQTTTAYNSIIINNSYPYLMGINMLFFFLAVILLISDIYEKYGSQLHSEEPPLPRGPV